MKNKKDAQSQYSPEKSYQNANQNFCSLLVFIQRYISEQLLRGNNFFQQLKTHPKLNEYRLQILIDNCLI